MTRTLVRFSGILAGRSHRFRPAEVARESRKGLLMTGQSKLVIVASHGLQDERATVAWTIANGGIAGGLGVTMFLVSSAVDAVRKGAADRVRMNPIDPPLKDLVRDFMANGGTVWACPPCAKVRGYGEANLLDGVVIAGSASLHGLIVEGAATLSI